MIAHGIDTIYALPGVQNDFLFEALFKAGDRMRTVHTRHEQGAAYMALGAALATGRPQPMRWCRARACSIPSAALLTAYSMNAPVLALIGEIPDADIGRHLGHLHEIRDQAGILIAAGGLFGAASASAEQAPRLVAEAMRAMADRPARARPRCNARSTSGASPARSRRSRRCRCAQPKLDETAIRKAAKLLGAAKNPDDRLRRRRAEAPPRKSPRSPPCCRRRCSAIAAAAACSTAAIR